MSQDCPPKNSIPPTPRLSFLSPFQQRAGAAAITCLAALVVVGFAAGVVWLLGRFLAAFSSVLWPVLIAALLSFLLQPVCVWLERKARFPRPLAIAVLYLAVAAVCALLALLVLPVVFHQFAAFVRALPGLWEDVARQAGSEGVFQQWLAQTGLLGTTTAEAPTAANAAAMTPAQSAAVAHGSTAPQTALLEQLKSVAGLTLPALAKAGSHAQAFFAKVAGAAIIPVYLAYLLNMRRDFGHDLRRHCDFLPASWREDIVFLARQFTGIMVSYFRGQILIGVILGVLMATGFTVAGLRFGLLIGLCVGLLNVVPYLGTMLGLGVALPLAYFQPNGGAGTLVAVLVVFLVAQLCEGYWLTPRIMGKTTGLHPMAIIFSVFFWGVALDGLLGMVLAVPLTAFFVVFWRLAKNKYLPKTEAAPSGQITNDE